jgi:nucleoside phosphorylase
MGERAVSPGVAVVLTAIQVETEAVLRHLTNRDRELVGDTWFQIGRFNIWKIAVAEVGSGNAIAASIAVRALSHFRPQIAAFVGVAGGVKDVALGDVVVATKVYAYEAGKEMPEGFRARPSVQTSHHELEQRARVLRTDARWYRRLDSRLGSNRHPAVHVGPIGAGEAVVADNAGRIATLIALHYGDTLAIEMEGRGFLEAAHIDSGCRAVVVRGISDLLAGKADSDRVGWQQYAADAAAAFFFEMLAFEKRSHRGLIKWRAILTVLVVLSLASIWVWKEPVPEEGQPLVVAGNGGAASNSIPTIDWGKVDILYYPKTADQGRVLGVIKGLSDKYKTKLNFRIGETDSEQFPWPTDEITCTPDVPLKPAKALALALVEAGVEIRSISTFNDPQPMKLPKISIQSVGLSDSGYPVLTKLEIAKMTTCSLNPHPYWGLVPGR